MHLAIRITSYRMNVQNGHFYVYYTVVKNSSPLAAPSLFAFVNTNQRKSFYEVGLLVNSGKVPIMQ